MHAKEVPLTNYHTQICIPFKFETEDKQKTKAELLQFFDKKS